MPRNKGSSDQALRTNAVWLAPATPGAGRWVKISATHPTAEARRIALALVARYCRPRGVQPHFYTEDGQPVLYLLVNTIHIITLRKQASELSRHMGAYGLIVTEGDAQHPIVPPPFGREEEKC